MYDYNNETNNMASFSLFQFFLYLGQESSLQLNRCKIMEWTCIIFNSNDICSWFEQQYYPSMGKTWRLFVHIKCNNDNRNEGLCIAMQNNLERIASYDIYFYIIDSIAKWYFFIDEKNLSVSMGSSFLALLDFVRRFLFTVNSNNKNNRNLQSNTYHSFYFK